MDKSSIIIFSIVIAISAVMVLLSAVGIHNITLIMTLCGILIVVCLLWIISLARKGTTVNLSEIGVNIKGPMVNMNISYNEITSMELRDQMSYGIRTFGYGGINVCGGTFANKEFGTYKISADNRIKKFIIIRYAKGTFVFNLKNPESTVMTYESIRKRARNIG